MLVFVTGVAGSGKSTLRRHLVALGHAAHDADDGIAYHVDARDRTPVAAPPRSGQTPQWAARHEFRFDIESVRALDAGDGDDDTTFLLGAAYGDDEVIEIADLAFYLDLEEAELTRRLTDRGPDGYGSAPHELEAILAWHAAAADRYEALGARRLDAARPVGEIAGELLAWSRPGGAA